MIWAMTEKKDYSNIIDQRFGKLLVKDVVHRTVKGHRRLYCLCDCDCGKTDFFMQYWNFARGPQQSCGCSNRKIEQDVIRDHSYLVGQKFGKLTVTGIKVGKDYKGHKTPLCVCKCDCGKENVIVNKSAVIRGHTKSCGCSAKYHVPWVRSFHSSSRERVYNAWIKLVERCLNPNDKAYHNYGGRGITVCDEWLGKEGFANFRKWSYENGYADDLTIDRIDNDKGYSPENCRWTDTKTQAYNKRVPKNSASGVRGVRKRNHCNKWTSNVYIDGKPKYLGDFDSLEEAAAARNKYIRENNLPNQPSYIPGTKEEY